MLFRELYTIDEVVEALGGPKPAVELAGRSVALASQNVWNWKAAGGFPPDTYDVFSRALEEKSCRAPRALWRFHKSAEHNERNHANTTGR